MDNEVNKIIREIINCPNIEQHFSSKINNSCNDIIGFQQGVKKNLFQIPEPFSGEIDKAKILIIGSNPSVDLKQKELFPTYEWDENSIIEYFYKRFEKYINNGTSKKNKDGSYRTVQYWSGIKGRVKEIFELINKEFTPGIDYCITEIVHCKSNGEKGLTNAVGSCNKYLKEIIKLSPASLLIIAGKQAQKLFCEQYKLEKYLNQKVSNPENIEGKERLMYFIPHPNSWGILKKMKYYLNNNEINKIKDWITNNF